MYVYMRPGWSMMCVSLFILADKVKQDRHGKPAALPVMSVLEIGSCGTQNFIVTCK